MDKLEKDILALITENSRLTTDKIAAMLGADKKTVAEATAKLEEG